MFRPPWFSHQTAGNDYRLLRQHRQQTIAEDLQVLVHRYQAERARAACLRPDAPPHVPSVFRVCALRAQTRNTE